MRYTNSVKKRFLITIVGLALGLVGCSLHSKAGKLSALSKEERVWMEKFLRNFLFEEDAIYTLTGSKPMTSFSICRYPPSEEKEDMELGVYFCLNKGDLQDRLLYRTLSTEQKKYVTLVEERDWIYPMSKLWEQWEEIQERFPINKRFLLVKKEYFEEQLKKYQCVSGAEIYFIDVFHTALIIQENYPLFKEAVGFEFDPLEIVLDFEKDTAHFWSAIHSAKYSYLWGLLYGFGKANSFAFYWKNRHMGNLDRHREEKVVSSSIIKKSSSQDRPIMSAPDAFSIRHFFIPTFASFAEDDPIVSKYKKEREKIKKMYKNRDFIDFTLELLTEPKIPLSSPFYIEND